MQVFQWRCNEHVFKIVIGGILGSTGGSSGGKAGTSVTTGGDSVKNTNNYLGGSASSACNLERSVAGGRKVVGSS